MKTCVFIMDSYKLTDRLRNLPHVENLNVFGPVLYRLKQNDENDTLSHQFLSFLETRYLFKKRRNKSSQFLNKLKGQRDFLSMFGSDETQHNRLFSVRFAASKMRKPRCVPCRASISDDVYFHLFLYSHAFEMQSSSLCWQGLRGYPNSFRHL